MRIHLEYCTYKTGPDVLVSDCLASAWSGSLDPIPTQSLVALTKISTLQKPHNFPSHSSYVPFIPLYHSSPVLSICHFFLHLVPHILIIPPFESPLSSTVLASIVRPLCDPCLFHSTMSALFCLGPLGSLLSKQDIEGTN